jgi:hypothetical protein
MKISCNIIRDLLPLYAEDLASQDTKELVDAHLCSCEDCTNVLNSMRKSPPIPAEGSAESLNLVKKTIRRRRILSVMAAVMTVITIASAVFTYMFTPFQLTKEQALEDFYVREDGAVVLDYSPYVTGRSLSGMNENWFIHQYSTRYDMWKGDNRKSIEELYGSDGIITEEEKLRYENIDVVYGTWESADGKVKSDAPIPWLEDAVLVTGANDWNWWYFDPNGLGNDTLLYDAGKELPEKEDRIHFAPVYPFLFFGGIGLALVLLAMNRFSKKSWLKELSMRFLILTCSLAGSVLFVSNGRIFTSDVGVIDQYWGVFIGMNTAFLTLTVLFWRQLYLLNKQDKSV